MRRAYLVICVGLSAIAAFAYHGMVGETAVLVAARDLAPGTQLRDGDIAETTVAARLAPSVSVTRREMVIGRWLRIGLVRDQPLLESFLGRSADAGLPPGYELPTGFRVIAVPVTPASAVGGWLRAGDRVDIYASPLPGRLEPGIGTPSAASVVDTALTVLGLRTDQGLMYAGDQAPSSRGAIATAPQKLATLILAVPQDDVARIAALETSSVFVAVLSGH